MSNTIILEELPNINLNVTGNSDFPSLHVNGTTHTLGIGYLTESDTSMHDCYFTGSIEVNGIIKNDSLQEKINKLQEQLDVMKEKVESIWYMPGAPGYEEAKASFNNAIIEDILYKDK